MAGVNKTIHIGNLGKDPEVRHLDNGGVVANFSIAISEKYKDRNSGETIENTEWVNIVLWKGLAEIAEKYLKKGSQVYIEGKLKTRSWEKDGITRYTTEVVGDKMTMLGGKSDNQDNSDTEREANRQRAIDRQEQSNPQNQTGMDFPDNSGIDDELPF